MNSIWLSFAAGLAAPLTAVCVLPLYPGFIAYLASQKKSRPLTLGVLVLCGSILSMGLFGLIFTLLLQESLSRAISVVSPIAFIILALASLPLILGYDLSSILPLVNTPTIKNPYISSIVFGMFFGLIILPCNPASLLVLFALSSSVTSALTNLIGFIMFGVGMGIPLLLLALLSDKSKRFINILTKHHTSVHRITGMIMLLISLYYLIFVFKVI